MSILMRPRMASFAVRKSSGTWVVPLSRFGIWWSIRPRNAARGVVAVVTIADDLEAARWVVRAADLDPRVYAAVSES